MSSLRRKQDGKLFRRAGAISNTGQTIRRTGAISNTGETIWRTGAISYTGETIRHSRHMPPLEMQRTGFPSGQHGQSIQSNTGPLVDFAKKRRFRAHMMLSDEKDSPEPAVEDIGTAGPTKRKHPLSQKLRMVDYSPTSSRAASTSKSARQGASVKMSRWSGGGLTANGGRFGLWSPHSEESEDSDSLTDAWQELMQSYDINTKPPNQIIEEKLRKRPKVENLTLEKDGKGGITAKWIYSQYDLPTMVQLLVYCDGQLLQTSVVRNRNDGFGSFDIPNPDPSKNYQVKICGFPETGSVDQVVKSEKVMICDDLGSILVNETRPLREGYNVYEGYLKSATPALEKVAVKILVVRNQTTFGREIRHMQRLIAHENVVLYRTSGKLPGFGGQAFIVSEICQRDTLYEIAADRTKLPLDQKTILRHVMKGLQHIHANNILHRDLKPQNILSSLDGRNMKITDFGLSKELKPDMSQISKTGREIGTAGWGSPEHYEENSVMSEKSDIYSAGLVFHFTLSGGKHVFGNEEHRWKSRIIDDHPVDLSNLQTEDTEIAKDLIQKMLARDPNKRPTAEDVLNHPYFWNEQRRFRFLNLMNKFFAAKETLTCHDVVKELDQNFMVIATRQGRMNWLQKIKESNQHEMKVSFVLHKARNRWTTYNHGKISDLVRFIRNIEEHYLERGKYRAVFESSAQIWSFFQDIFPQLLTVVYNVVKRRWPNLMVCADFPADAVEFFHNVAGPRFSRF